MRRPGISLQLDRWWRKLKAGFDLLAIPGRENIFQIFSLIGHILGGLRHQDIAEYSEQRFLNSESLGRLFRLADFPCGEMGDWQKESRTGGQTPNRLILSDGTVFGEILRM
jgi:hypothetical protein